MIYIIEMHVNHTKVRHEIEGDREDAHAQARKIGKEGFIETHHCPDGCDVFYAPHRLGEIHIFPKKE